jgi:benzil reductase ((S)-benzoin forming)
MMKKILITGCTKGLGFSLALQFAKEGCYVFAVGRNIHQLKKLAEQSSFIQTIAADITTIDGRQKITQAVGNEILSIVHNAAIAEPMQFANLSENSLRLHFETNYFAPLLITQQLLPLLKGQRVLHISSGAASIPLAGLLPYCATKAALEHTTQCLNAELNLQEIYFANLRPGMVDTDMQLHLRSSSEAVLPDYKFYIDAKQTGQLVAPEKVAKFVARVMLETDHTTFSNTAWNIHDEKHQK